jgi:hypothetical protein
MIWVRRGTPVAVDAAKARAIVESGRAVSFVGDARQLRRLRDELDGAPGLSTFLGEDGDRVMLIVEPVGPTGFIATDRI